MPQALDSVSDDRCLVGVLHLAARRPAALGTPVQKPDVVYQGGQIAEPILCKTATLAANNVKGENHQSLLADICSFCDGM